MQESNLSKNACLAALNRIADELAELRKMLKPGRPAQSEAERAEEVKRIQRKIFGDED